MNRILCHRREIESKNIHRKTRNVFQNNSKVICRDWHEHICAPLPRSLSQANSSQDKSSDGNASWAEPTEPKPRRDTPRQDKTSVAKKSATATSDKALLEITWNTRVCVCVQLMNAWSQQVQPTTKKWRLMHQLEEKQSLQESLQILNNKWK